MTIAAAPASAQTAPTPGDAPVLARVSFEVNGKETPTQGWVDDVSTQYALDFIRANAALAASSASNPPRIPLIAPSIRNGRRMNPSVAPTSRCSTEH